MSMKYIRDYYHVPAKRGGRVCFTGYGQKLFATITGSHDAYIRIRFDGDKKSHPFHPTWKITYLDAPLPTCAKNAQVEASVKEVG